MLFKQFAIALLAASATAATTILRRSLPTGTVTCGDNDYTSSAIEAAINAGVKDMEDNNLPGVLLFTTL